ncbi:DUF1036 domain-containing protein [Fulvimarina endophytica]|uniref:DUF1036 domain-containing protein n=1 Tax=Fulvimarina endophytica TaxID=2293836 RepID=A0A371WZU3_9HYPH|nr:DUF1036 domain-containing protein [Fulvimarina endophytica]RFC62485.1 DUF1036 domain-containing protein [Fulvimarina endophytica]
MGALALSIFGFGGVGEAKADFRVCNGTTNLVGVAIAYRADAGWISEGWWRIPAETCKPLITGRLNSRFYYLYAEDANGESRWAGDIDLCVAENEFKIAGVSECLKRGYQSMGFREFDTGEQDSWMVQLTEPPRSTTETE